MIFMIPIPITSLALQNINAGFIASRTDMAIDFDALGRILNPISKLNRFIYCYGVYCNVSL